MIAWRSSLRNRVRTLSSIALFAASFGSVGVARAEDNRGGTERGVTAEDRRKAKERYREGVEAYEAGLYQLSIEYFAAADRLAPSAALSFNIARAHEKLGQSSAAVVAYRDYLRREPTSANAGVARQRIAALEPRSERSKDQRVSAQNLGNEEAAKADAGQPASSEVAMARDERTAASFSRQTSSDPVLAATERPGLGAWPVVALSAGGAALVTAGVFEILRRDAVGEVKEAQRENDERGPKAEHSQVDLAALSDTAEARQTAAQLSFGVGAALLITGGVMFLVDDRLTRPRATSAGLSVGPGRVAASMTTRF